MSTRPRTVVQALVCALARGCQTGSSSRSGASVRAPASADPTLPVAQAKVDPLQPPPRDPVRPEDVRASQREEVAQAPAPASGPFDPALLTGTWAGTYLYSAARGGAAQGAFFADLAFDGAKVSGSIVELITFRDDSTGAM